MKTPQELHEWVRSYNWDDGLAPIWPVVQSDTTELATALLIYWRLEGPWFQGGAHANEEAGRLHALVERRLLEGVYAKGSVRYDPVADNGLSRVQISKLKQSGLPIQFLEPVYGS
jgi:hypothetical protein